MTPFSSGDADVEPAELARGGLADGHRTAASSSRSTTVDVYVAMRSWKTSDASVWGQPSTGSSSLMPVGTPPNGFETSADAAAARARSASTNEKQLRSDASIAASVASSSSTGERSPARNASTSEHASPFQG